MNSLICNLPHILCLWCPKKRCIESLFPVNLTAPCVYVTDDLHFECCVLNVWKVNYRICYCARSSGTVKTHLTLSVFPEKSESWEISCCKGHLVYSFKIIFMITLSSRPSKTIKFSLLKVVDPPPPPPPLPPNFLLKFNMADVKLSLRERLPTFQMSWDHVIPQLLRCGLGIPHLHSCGIGRCGNAGYISLAPACAGGLQFNFRWVQIEFRDSWFLWLLFPNLY